MTSAVCSRATRVSARLSSCRQAFCCWVTSRRRRFIAFTVEIRTSAFKHWHLGTLPPHCHPENHYCICCCRIWFPHALDLSRGGSAQLSIQVTHFSTLLDRTDSEHTHMCPAALLSAAGPPTGSRSRPICARCPHDTTAQSSAGGSPHSCCPSEPTSLLRFSGEGCLGRACTAVGSSKGEGRWRPQSSADSASLGSESSEARDAMSSSSWRQQHRQ